MAIVGDPWFPPLTIKTEVYADTEGHVLTLRLAFMADGCAHLIGTEKPIWGDAKGQRRNFVVSQEWFAELFSELQALRMPALPMFKANRTDGGPTELKIGGEDEGSTRYRWWSEPPKEWSGLGRFVRKIRFAYEALRRFPESRQEAEDRHGCKGSAGVAGFCDLSRVCSCGRRRIQM